MGAVLDRVRAAQWRVAMVVPLRGPAGLFGPSCEAIGELARRHGVDTPIVDAVRRVCAGEVSAGDVGDELINRERKPE